MDVGNMNIQNIIKLYNNQANLNSWYAYRPKLHYANDFCNKHVISSNLSSSIVVMKIFRMFNSICESTLMNILTLMHNIGSVHNAQHTPIVNIISKHVYIYIIIQWKISNIQKLGIANFFITQLFTDACPE